MLRVYDMLMWEAFLCTHQWETQGFLWPYLSVFKAYPRYHPALQRVLLLLLLLLLGLVVQAKKRWEAEMKERGLSKDEAFMVETAQSAEIVSQHKSKKEKHKAAFGGCDCS